MENLVLDGKKYVKASVIARELGYTSDYVGQLCRAGKVDATLVGRSWYVVGDSLRNHKQNRYRSTKETSLREIKAVRQSEDALKQPKGSAVPIHRVAVTPSAGAERSARPESFYTRAPQNWPTQTEYLNDDEELMPPLSKSEPVETELEVKLDGAAPIAVKAGEASYKLAATEPAKVRFKGTLAVGDAEAEPEATSTESAKDSSDTPGADQEQSEPVKKPSAIRPEITPESDDKTSKIRIKLNNRKHRKIPEGASHEHNEQGVVSMRRVLGDERTVVGGTLAVPGAATKAVGTVYFIIIPLMVGLSLGCAALMLGIEGRVSSTPDSLSQSYNFSFSTLGHSLEMLVTRSS